MNVIGKAAKICSDKIVGFAGGNEQVKEAFSYVLKRIFNQIIILSILMIIVYPFKLSKAMFVYYAISTAFRLCFGGWHAKNDTTCLILSILVPITGIVLAVIGDYRIEMVIITYILAAIVGIKLGTFVHPNRPLGNDIGTVKKRTKRLKLTGVSILILLFIFHIIYIRGEMSNVITISVLISFVFRVLAK